MTIVYNNKIVRVVVTNDDEFTFEIRLMRSTDVYQCFGQTMIIRPYKWWELQRFITIPAYYLSELLSKNLRKDRSSHNINAITIRLMMFVISSIWAAVISEIVVKFIKLFYPLFPVF